eukprot:15978-Heterococcus_DN1.PRE.6
MAFQGVVLQILPDFEGKLASEHWKKRAEHGSTYCWVSHVESSVVREGEKIFESAGRATSHQGHFNGRIPCALRYNCNRHLLTAPFSLLLSSMRRSSSMWQLAALIASALLSSSLANLSCSNGTQSCPDYGAQRRSSGGAVAVTVVQAINLRTSDTYGGGVSDPYVQLQAGSITVRTRTAPNTLNPVWGEKVLLQRHNSGDNITVSIMDADSGLEVGIEYIYSGLPVTTTVAGYNGATAANATYANYGKVYNDRSHRLQDTLPLFDALRGGILVRADSTERGRVGNVPYVNISLSSDRRACLLISCLCMRYWCLFPCVSDGYNSTIYVCRWIMDANAYGPPSWLLQQQWKLT